MNLLQLSFCLCFVTIHSCHQLFASLITSLLFLTWNHSKLSSYCFQDLFNRRALSQVLIWILFLLLRVHFFTFSLWLFQLQNFHFMISLPNSLIFPTWCSYTKFNNFIVNSNTFHLKSQDQHCMISSFVESFDVKVQSSLYRYEKGQIISSN